jgi:hypothetical protein
MSMQLPTPIALYFTAENADRPDDLTACIASNARVFDEGRAYEGLAAIKTWKAATKAKYNHSVEPLEAQERDGKIVVKCRLTGDFPGSPVIVDFFFKLEGDKIKALDIG